MAPPIPVPLLSLHPLMLGRSSSLAASRASSIIVQKDLQLLHRGDLVVMYLLHWKGLFWVLVQKKKKMEKHHPAFISPTGSAKCFYGFHELGRFLSQATHWAPKQLGKTRERGRAAAAPPAFGNEGESG